MSDPLLRATRYLAELEFDGVTPQPAAFIVGAPRSGTTILHQSLCYVSDVGYVDNLVARFFWYPELGLSVANELNYPRRWRGRSSFGATQDLSEPHEFGRFWLEQLGYHSMQQQQAPGRPLADAAKALERMSSVAGKALLFKVFTLVWHLAEFHNAHAPRSRWILIRRELAAVALSLLKLRLSRGAIGTWRSLVPLSALDYTDPYEQVVAQAIDVERWIEAELAQIPNEAWTSVHYDVLCSDFTNEIERLTRFLGISCSPERLREAQQDISVQHKAPDSLPGVDMDRLRAVIRAFGH